MLQTWTRDINCLYNFYHYTVEADHQHTHQSACSQRGNLKLSVTVSCLHRCSSERSRELTQYGLRHGGGGKTCRERLTGATRRMK